MDRKKGFLIILLTILAAGFVIFVAIMQHNFTNPQFADLSTQAVDDVTNDEEDTDNDSEDTESDSADDSADEIDDSQDSAGAGVAFDENEEDDEPEDNTDQEITYSTRTVDAETLNVRSGPGIDYDIAGMLVEGQVIEVEDSGDEWVRVITDDFSGYVNENYLSGE